MVPEIERGGGDCVAEEIEKQEQFEVPEDPLLLRGGGGSWLRGTFLLFISM